MLEEVFISLRTLQL